MAGRERSNVAYAAGIMAGRYLEIQRTVLEMKLIAGNVNFPRIPVLEASTPVAYGTCAYCPCIVSNPGTGSLRGFQGVEHTINHLSRRVTSQEHEKNY